MSNVCGSENTMGPWAFRSRGSAVSISLSRAATLSERKRSKGQRWGLVPGGGCEPVPRTLWVSSSQLPALCS